MDENRSNPIQDDNNDTDQLSQGASLANQSNNTGVKPFADTSGLTQSNDLSGKQSISSKVNFSNANDTSSSSGASDQSQTSAAPLLAEDVDLIEKEWVNKAKNIVANTRNDPSQQNIQLSHFKAEYLKKRFSKNIKPMDS